MLSYFTSITVKVCTKLYPIINANISSPTTKRTATKLLVVNCHLKTSLSSCWPALCQADSEEPVSNVYRNYIKCQRQTLKGLFSDCWNFAGVNGILMNLAGWDGLYWNDLVFGDISLVLGRDTLFFRIYRLTVLFLNNQKACFEFICLSCFRTCHFSRVKGWEHFIA